MLNHRYCSFSGFLPLIILTMWDGYLFTWHVLTIWDTSKYLPTILCWGSWVDQCSSQMRWWYRRTPSLHVISCLFGNWVNVPKFLSCLMREIFHVPRSNPIKLGNMVKFSTFFIAWSKILCCGPRFLEVMSQNYQAAKTGTLFTAQTNQAAMLDFFT